MHRDADGARLIGDRTGDRLADPPGRIGRKLVAAAVLELVDRFHQADVAFLDQIQELQAAVGVLLGDGNHQSQVRLDHFLLRTARLGLADRDFAIDLLDVVDRQVMALLDFHQLLLPSLDLVLQTRERRGILLPGLHVLGEPARAGLVLRERGDEILARHARVAHRDDHDLLLDLPDLVDVSPQLVGQSIEHAR